MAQAKKKTAAKKPSGPWSGIAIYNLDAGTERGDQVRAVAEELGIPCKTIKPQRLGDPVGAFAGLPGLRHRKTDYTGEAPSYEFMLVCKLTDKQLNALLAALRQADAQIERKAVVTKPNAMWPLHTLMHEVSKEHEALASRQSKEAAR